MVNKYIPPHCSLLDEETLNGKKNTEFSELTRWQQGGSYHWLWVD